MTAKDMKESLSSGRKPDTTHVRTPIKVYIARASEYGDKRTGGKYIRANYLRPASAHPTGSDDALRAEFRRHRDYLRAGVGHFERVLDAMELHEATDPDLLDIAAMKRAVYAEDTDAMPGCAVGPSGLPHHCGGAASINMALMQAVTYGLLPADPGQPWRKAFDPSNVVVTFNGVVLRGVEVTDCPIVIEQAPAITKASVAADPLSALVEVHRLEPDPSSFDLEVLNVVKRLRSERLCVAADGVPEQVPYADIMRHAARGTGGEIADALGRLVAGGRLRKDAAGYEVVS